MAEALATKPSQQLLTWVIDDAVDEGTLERLADARELAGVLGGNVGLLIIGTPTHDAQRLFAAGADHVCSVPTEDSCQNTFVFAATTVLRSYNARVVLASGESFRRECACRLAVRCGWKLVSPALMVQAQEDRRLVATALDPTGKFARRVDIEHDETVVVTIRSGVGEPLPSPHARPGTFETIAIPLSSAPVLQRRLIPANSETNDIRYVRRLVAGGRGLGSRQGFDKLRQIAGKLNAGVAASRAAVDAGWIEYERQVGQTGKTVKPDLYIACGISGAGHHLEGMSESTHIVSINNDPKAPIHQKSHLALIADLYQVLDAFEHGLNR